MNEDQIHILKKYFEKSINFNLKEWKLDDIDNFVYLANQLIEERPEDKGAWSLLFLANLIKVLKLSD